MNKEREICGVKVIVSDETYNEYKGTLEEQLEEKDKEIERLRKREKKWEKWTTEKEILSTRMSEYLCKWRNIKREYKNQVESNRLKKQKIERLNNIIDELEKWLKESATYEPYVYNGILDKLSKLKEGKE